MIKPTNLSNTCLANCAFTFGIFSFTGFFIAFFTADLVISRNIIRFVCCIERLNVLQICQAIASPSRSSSVAKITSSAFLIYVLSNFIFLALFSSNVNVGSKLFLISIQLRPFVNSRICPKLARHLYPSPKKDSIFLHLAGDSTITNIIFKLILVIYLNDLLNFLVSLYKLAN